MNYNEAFEKLNNVVSLLKIAADLLYEVKESSEYSDGKCLELTLQDLMYENTTPHELARKLFHS